MDYAITIAMVIIIGMILVSLMTQLINRDAID
ncbi:hypothetical protein MSWAN_2268 [Methanobacterium paludis]|uniref:Uncharacterized protein n=1 Tax=Methanobacterium paludis (strain DSM 25820 / JCM 18151 / SWAN1) TaxID=868131 RepID=F6D4Z5_METPW|nr:hypothetical protein MSWAN_2268 [Methanobacterium paludis]